MTSKKVFALTAVTLISLATLSEAQSTRRFIERHFAAVGDITKVVQKEIQEAFAPPPGENSPLVGEYELRDEVRNSYCIFARNLSIEVSPSQGHVAFISNTVTSDEDAVCEIGIMPNQRYFKLARVEDDCGSRVYKGFRNVGFQTLVLTIQDNSTRTCRSEARDARPMIEVSEQVVRPSLDDVETVTVNASATARRP